MAVTTPLTVRAAVHRRLVEMAAGVATASLPRHPVVLVGMAVPVATAEMSATAGLGVAAAMVRRGPSATVGRMRVTPVPTEQMVVPVAEEAWVDPVVRSLVMAETAASEVKVVPAATVVMGLTEQQGNMQHRVVAETVASVKTAAVGVTAELEALAALEAPAEPAHTAQ